MKHIEKILNELTEAKLETIKAEIAWEKDPENKEFEEAFDRAYDKECKLYDETADEISKASGGAITRKIAQRMVWHKQKEILSILNRAE